LAIRFSGVSPPTQQPIGSVRRAGRQARSVVAHEEVSVHGSLRTRLVPAQPTEKPKKKFFLFYF